MTGGVDGGVIGNACRKGKKIGHSGLLPVPDYKTLLVWLFHMVVRWYVICQEIALDPKSIRTSSGIHSPTKGRIPHT